MRRRAICGTIIVGTFFVLSVPQAWAAKAAYIDSEKIEVRQGPNKKSRVLFVLKKGTRISASNLPTEGFFKVRTANGEVGWVPSEAVLLKPESLKGAAGGASANHEAREKEQEPAPAAEDAEPAEMPAF